MTDDNDLARMLERLVKIRDDMRINLATSANFNARELAKGAAELIEQADRMIAVVEAMSDTLEKPIPNPRRDSGSDH